jgi:Copper type II ascorbate-dependent monooxygenase, C-terminal domain
MLHRALALSLLLAAAGSAGCSGGETAPPPPLTCAKGQELFQGACVDPALRYEPAKRIDTDNVSAYGDPLTQLKLPDPPKSGFRIVAPPRTMKAGEEAEFCLSWPIPKTVNHIVYAARLHTTPGLHHSNVIAKPVDAKAGPNPYPGCHKGASDPFNQLPDVIPDVFFANSTQIVGEETLAFPPGIGFRYDPAREISTDMHLLNTTAEEQTVEVVYDFFTMPESDLTHEVAPFVLQVNDFLIPPHSIGKVGSDCSVFGGEIVSLMPHTHKLATDFTADFHEPGGDYKRVMDTGPYDAQSHIKVYDPELSLQNVSSMRYECTFNNTTDHDVVYGIGENEMCVLFGYIYPVKTQFVAYSDYQGKPCNSVQIGLFR